MIFINRLLLASSFCLVIGCHSAAENTQKHLTKGMDYYQKGDFTKARIELKNVLQINDKQADAFYYLALIDEKEKNWQSMYENLMRTIELNSKNNEARLKLGQMQIESPDQAFEQVTAILKNIPNDPGALTLKAAVLFRQDKTAEATALLEQVLKQHPDFLDAISLKIMLYIAKNDFTTALNLVNNSLLTHPKEVSLHSLRLQIHDKEKNTAAIEQDYIELIKHFPDKLDFNYALAKHYSDIKQYDKAVALLQTTIKNNPAELMPKLVFTDYVMQNNSKQVETTIQGYLQQYPNEPELVFRLVTFYLQQQHYSQAKQSLNLLIDSKKDSKEALKAKMLLAKISLADKDTKHLLASKLIAEILKVDPTYADALLLKAQLTLGEKRYDEAISELRTVLNYHPASDAAHVLLAEVYQRQQSPELAQESLRKALEFKPDNIDALIPVVRKLIANKDFIRATDLVQNGLNANPNNVQLLQILAQIRLNSNDLNGVQEISSLFSKTSKNLGYSQYLEGKVLQGEEKYEAALVKYKEALVTDPKLLLSALKGIAECYEKLNQRAAIFTYLDEYIKVNPENVDAYSLKAQLLNFDKRPEQAQQILTTAIKKWPKIVALYIQLAQTYVLPEEIDKIFTVYKEGIAAVPDNIDLQMGLAALYEQRGDYNSALKIYETLLINYPDSDNTINSLASLLLDHYPAKETIARAVKLAERFEKAKEPYFLDTYAWSLVKTARYEEAVRLLQTLITKYPDVAVFRYHLGVAYHNKNDNPAAINELKQALVLGEKTTEFAEKKATEALLNEIQNVAQ